MEQLRSADVVISNDDLLRLILVCLPVKSLVRFKSVSKQWRCIISDDREFAIQHSRGNSDSNAACGIYLYRFGVPDLCIPLVPIFGDGVPSLNFLHCTILECMLLESIQSCNGLLLCSFRGFDVHSFQLYKQIGCVVCNPTTRDFKLLPPTPPALTSFDNPEQIYERNDLTLVFNPSKSHHYKVVAFKLFYHSDVDCELHIYSSKTNSWEFKRYIDHKKGKGEHSRPGVHLNDKIYWLVERHFVLSYDINSEDFGYIDIPAQLFKKPSVLTQSHGRLYLAASFSCDYGNGTRTLISEIDSSSVRCSNHPVKVLDTVSEEYYRLLGAVKGENETDLLVLHSTSTTLISTDAVYGKNIIARELESHRSMHYYHFCEYIHKLYKHNEI